MSKFLSPIFILLNLAIPQLGHAWGIGPHQIIAEIAQIHLLLEVRHRIRKEFDILYLADVANWADQVKGDRNQKNWHYTNIAPEAWVYEQNRDCKDKSCVTEKIPEFIRILKDSQKALKVRREALQYLAHFIGDIHQPLHMGNARDRGGNDIIVQFRGEKTNLHALWDYGLIFRNGKSLIQYARQLKCKKEPKDAFEVDSPPVEYWTNESRALALKYAYPVSLNDRGELSRSYVQSSRNILDQRMCRAGIRLAHLLNQLLTEN